MLSTALADNNLTALSSPTIGFTEPRARDRLRLSANRELVPRIANEGTEPSLGETSEMPATRVSRAVEITRSFKTLESWVGKVLQVNPAQRTFTASVISDKQNGVREDADFSFDEVSPDDESFILEGAIFYWSVGYEINEYKRRSTASVVRFQRLRHWTAKELQSARARAANYADWFLAAEEQIAKGITTAAK